MDVPADLTSVFTGSLRIFHVRLEIHDSPSRVFAKRQVDHGVEDADKIVLNKDGKLAMAPLRIAGSLKQRMLQGGSYGLGGRFYLFLGGTQQAGVGSR